MSILVQYNDQDQVLVCFILGETQIRNQKVKCLCDQLLQWNQLTLLCLQKNSITMKVIEYHSKAAQMKENFLQLKNLRLNRSKIGSLNINQKFLKQEQQGLYQNLGIKMQRQRYTITQQQNKQQRYENAFQSCQLNAFPLLSQLYISYINQDNDRIEHKMKLFDQQKYFKSFKMVNIQHDTFIIKKQSVLKKIQQKLLI